ncbi:hypothetical protein [Agromyces sp. C10]|uniref:hypothetical protein n=1 Tax=Agromyces sp. C10 TaxID=2935077 RepID=UPI00200A7226|nr:hypothetical protein [Agromyces sp. C10]MCK8610689.1 hypothetical protein [Agromyces sp. C10]
MRRPRPNDAMTQHARLAWTIGGALLIASTFVAAFLGPVLWSVPGGEFLGPVLVAVALLLFAFGFRGAGSVTAGRPLGTVALVLLALWSFADRAVWWLLPLDESTPERFGFLFAAIPLLRAVLAAVACVQIARAGVVPAPWNWAPCWALVAVILPSLAQALVVAAAPQSADQAILTLLVSLDGLARAAAAVFLGVLAIVLANRLDRTRTVDIITPAR